MVYHGTSKDIDFSKFKSGKRGAWFTSDRESAGDYALENDAMQTKYNDSTRKYETVNTHSRVMPVFLNIKNLRTLTADEQWRLNSGVMSNNYVRAQSKMFDEIRSSDTDIDGIRYTPKEYVKLDVQVFIC